MDKAIDGSRLAGGIALSAGGAVVAMGGIVMAAVGDGTGFDVGGGAIAVLGAGMLVPAVLLLTSFKQHLEITPKQGVDLSLGPGFAYGRF